MSTPILPGGDQLTPAVGREHLIAQVHAALRRPGRAVLVGPPGIGKTTVLASVLDQARESGTAVILSSPSEAESHLPYAALADLLRPLVRHLGVLPAPQRIAVESLLDAAAAEVLDERAVAAGTLTLLARAARHPLVVALDDAMWLDDASARALTFALRRLVVPAVLCVRSGAPVPLGLEREARVIDVDPLPSASVCRLLQARLDEHLDRATLERIATESGGNPLLACELGRAVLRLPRPPTAQEDLPLVPATMTVLAAATLESLPDATTHALRLSALLTVPRLADLVAAGVRLVDLDPAVVGGFVELDQARVTFTHPVYATAVRASLEPGRRRHLHAVLAGAVGDPDERARQLAWAHIDPDDDVAAEVAASAERQQARGAQQAAAALFERASLLTTPGTTARAERLMAAARCRFDAGDLRAAASTAREVVATSSGDTAASALLLLADHRWYDDTLGPRTAYELGRDALALADPGSVTAGRVHLHLAIFAVPPLRSAEHSAHAVAIFEDSPAHRLELASSLLGQFLGEAHAGLPARGDLLDRALALEDGTPLWVSGTVPAIWWTTLDQTDRARSRLSWMLRHAAASGDGSWCYEILAHLACAEVLAGRLDAAAEQIDRLVELASGVDADSRQETLLLAELALLRGETERARQLVPIGAGREETDHWARWHLRLIDARLRLAEGRPAEAASTFAEVAAELDAVGMVEWQWQRFEPDWAEAACLAGDTAGARSVYERLLVRHTALPRPWTTVGTARVRLLVDHASGMDTTPALEGLVATLAAVPADAVLLDRGRAGLAGGRVAMARGDLDAARSLLVAAEAASRRAGATGIAELARTALREVRTHAPDTEAVRAALRAFRRPDRLTDSPLADGADAVRDLLRRSVDAVFGASQDDRLLAAVVAAAYFDVDSSHAHAMRSLHLSRTTYYRKLAAATERLAAWVVDEHMRRGTRTT